MRTADPEGARAKARALLAELGVAAPPVNVDKLVKQRNIVLQYAPLDEELSGVAYIKNGVKIIGVNALHHPNRQRFSAAHEFGHHCLHPEELSAHVHVDKVFRVLHRDEDASKGIDPLEIEANAFASELLMPEAFLRDAISDTGLDIEDEETIEALARKFRVSASAMRVRLAKYFR